MFVHATTGCISALSSTSTNNFVVVQVLVSEREITICTQVKITRARYGDYLGLPWAPGHEQRHRLFANGGMHIIHCFRIFWIWKDY